MTKQFYARSKGSYQLLYKNMYYEQFPHLISLKVDSILDLDHLFMKVQEKILVWIYFMDS